MRIARFLLALMLALTLGGAPVLAGYGKVVGTATHDCMGKAKTGCPCDDGQLPCATDSCKLICAGVVVLPSGATGMTHPRVGRYELPGSAPMRQQHPNADPPVPRA